MTHRRFACSKVLALVLPVTLGLACGLKRDWSVCAPDENPPCLPGYVCTPSFACVPAGDGGSDGLLAVDGQGATDVTGGGAEVALSVGTDASDTATGRDGIEPDRAPAAVPPDAAVSTVPDSPPVATLPDAASVSLADGPSVGLADAPPVGGPPDAPVPDAPPVGGPPDAPVVDAPPVGSPPDAPVLDAPPVDAPGTCATDKDCPALSPLCLGNRCAKCAGANDCTGRTGTPVCAASGLCVACATGTQQCNGLQPQTCNVSGAWQNNGNACPYVCNNATGACSGACALGTKQCSGSQPQTCDASGTWQNTGNACSGCYTCSTGTGACAPATGTPCDDGNACTTGDTCQAGVCMGTQIFCNSPPACKLVTTCSSGTCNYSQNSPDGIADNKCLGGTPYCYGGTCVKCTSDQHCSGAIPSCDPSTHVCVCRRPSSGNLLRNPGFDGSLNGWTVYTATLAADSEGCSGSNSVYVDNSETDPEQCVPLTAGTYYFGGKFKGGVAGNFFRLRFFTGDNCTGTGDNTLDLNLVGSTGWATLFMDVVAPSGTASVRVDFYGMQQYFDQLYLNTANQF